MKKSNILKTLISLILSICMAVSPILGTGAVFAQSTAATEVVYCGVTLNSDTPYLVYYVVSGEGMKVKAQADTTLGTGDTLLAYFDAENGTLTYMSGMPLTTDTDCYEPDFGWNTYAQAAQLSEGGDFYGIRANGDLTVDLNGYNNFIYLSWNILFKNNFYGIYADGDLTIKGDGYLKLPATFAQNLVEGKGDANATPHYSYGLYATGNINLQGGCVNIFSKMYQRWNVGSNANSTCVYAGKNIYLDGTLLKIRYQESVGAGQVKHFNKTPVGEDGYIKNAVPTAGLDTSGAFASIGYAYTIEGPNKNCFDYIPVVNVTGVSLSKSSMMLEKGNSLTLAATIKPANATNKNIIWSSDDETVATVEGGTVTAVSPGEATITAKTEDGQFAATCKVTVVLPAGTIRLVIDGNETPTDHPIRINEDGIVFVPMVETFRKLGVEMAFKGNGIYEGMGKNGDVIVDVVNGTVEIDWVRIELPAAPYLDNGTTMVPAYLIEDAIKTEPAIYDAANAILSVKSPDPNDKYYGGADIGEILKTLPAGKVILDHADLVGSNAWGTSNLGVTRKVSVNINGTNTSALQLKTGAVKYGVVPEIGDMAYCLSAGIGGQDFGKDDVGVIHFKARATEVTQTSGRASLRVLYERTNDWGKLGMKEFEIKHNEWNDYYVPLWGRPLGFYPPSADWPADKCRITIAVGALPQTVQVADFEVIYFGKNITIEQLQPDTGSYHGIEEDAIWRKEAWRRIEKYRKDDVAVKVMDSAGNPVEGVEIGVHQTESDFVFGIEGCHDEFVNLNTSTVHGYNHDLAMDSFNAFVCGVEMKLYRQLLNDGAKGIEMANEAFRRNMRFKGHALMWDDHTIIDPLSKTGNYQDLSYEDLYRNALDFFLPDVYSLKGKAEQWDVLNESYACNYVRTKLGTTRLYTDIAKMAHEVDPETKLFVTEAGTTGKDRGQTDRIPVLLSIVQQMQSEGAPVHGIGLQTHVSDYHYPQGLYRQLDECAQIVNEVAVTEFDFYHEKKENAGKYAGDLLIAAFSHPKCNTFIAWGHHSLDADRDTGLFYDLDWNEKPGKAVWDNLVGNVFKTNLNLVTDEEGRADFRGYHGEYEITVKYNGRERKFDFGLLKDGENTIEITIGDRIDAKVSCGKYLNIPESTDYPSMSEAADAYREKYGDAPYISLVLEKNLKGVLDSEGAILNGGSLTSNSDYTSGKIWGSASGLSAIASDEATGQGILYNNSASGSFDLSHLYSGKVYNDGNMEVSTIIRTDNSRTAGFSFALGYTTSAAPINLGYIKTTTSGYVLETLSGKQIKLKDNTNYNVLITLLQTDFPNVYDLKYTVEENCREVVAEHTEKQTGVVNLLGLKGIYLNATANGAEASGVLTLKQARVKFYTYDDLVSYQDAGTTAEVGYDALRHYNTANIVSLTDPAYLSGDSWGTANPETITDYFAYQTHSDHLYSKGSAPAGEQAIKKNIGSMKSGDSVEVDFDFFIDSPIKWYTSSGYADVRLESADGSVSRSLVQERYSVNISFYADFLGNASGEYQASHRVEYTDTITGEGDFNRNNLHVNLKLTPNAKGNYDAKMTLTNEFGTVNETYTVADYLTGAEFLKIDNFVFAGQTTKDGTSNGVGVAGIKNVIVKKTSTQVKDGDAIVLSEGDTVGIKFRNPLERPFDAQLVLVRYADDKFSSMKVIDFNGRRDAEGYLSIRVDKEKEEENRFMVMLLDSDNALKPLKKAEMIVISE